MHVVAFLPPSRFYCVYCNWNHSNLLDRQFCVNDDFDFTLHFHHCFVFNGDLTRTLITINFSINSKRSISKGLQSDRVCYATVWLWAAHTSRVSVMFDDHWAAQRLVGWQMVRTCSCRTRSSRRQAYTVSLAWWDLRSPVVDASLCRRRYIRRWWTHVAPIHQHRQPLLVWPAH